MANRIWGKNKAHKNVEIHLVTDVDRADEARLVEAGEIIVVGHPDEAVTKDMDKAYGMDAAARLAAAEERMGCSIHEKRSGKSLFDI